MAAELAVVQTSPQLTRPETFAPRTIAEAMEFAKMLIESGFLPKAYVGKPPSAIVVALQLGLELNLQPMQALQSIALINNTPAVFGDTALALIKAHPAFEYVRETIDEASMTATCEVKRRGEPTVIRTFSQKDAATAGLWGKAGPWTNYPKRMLQMRARGFAIRDQFPDALKGIVTAEEAQDYPGQTVEGDRPTESAPAQTTAKSAEEPTIGQPGGSEFFKLYKLSGWTSDDAKAWLRDNLKIGQPHNDKNSKDILVGDKDKAFTWAKTHAPVRVAAHEKFAALGFSDDERRKFVEDRKINWVEIDRELGAEIDKRNSQEQ